MKNTLRVAFAFVTASSIVLSTIGPVMAPVAYAASEEDNGGNQNPSASGTISGIVFNDLNENDVYDSGEPLIEGIVIKLHKGPSNETYNNLVVDTDTTDAAGAYYFGSLDSGNYFVEEIEPAVWEQTTSDTEVKITGNAGSHTVNFANVSLLPPTPVYVPGIGGLVVKKVVVGGSATPDMFSFSFNGAAQISFNANGENAYFAMATGTYAVTETATSTYTASYDNCAAVVVAVNATSTCTITNTYIAPVTPPANTGNGGGNGGGGNGGNTPAPVTTTGSNGGGGGGGYVASGPLSIGFTNTNPGGGTGTGGGLVLGASTDTPSCSTALLTTYMRQSQQNDTSEVIKLQTFLNSELGLTIPLTGHFGPVTESAVNTFQLKYKADVLDPWKPFGLADNTPTGYVYKTTRHKINSIFCPTLNAPFPQLP
jgi:hypothetical protein